MISGTRWCAAALMPLACAALAPTALAQDRTRSAQVRVASQSGGESVVVVTVGPKDVVPPVQVRVVQQACPGADQVPTSKTLEIARAATLCLLNAERAERGLQPLRAAQPITEASQAYSERMVQERFFAHETLDGYFLDDVYWIAAQNLAWGDGPLAAPARIVEGWMASPGHRRNILDPALSDIGVGIAIGSPEPRSRLNAATYTTDFGVVAEEAPAATSSRPVKVSRPAKVKWITKRQACATSKRAKRRAKPAERRKRTRCVQVTLRMQRLG
jgi:uncharacterized protein YkwD